MKPSNLEEVKDGKLVVTRDGIEVKQLTIFKVSSSIKIYGILDDSVNCWYENGKYNSNTDSPYDLFMKTKTKTLWFNVYYNKSREGFLLGYIFDTEEKTLEYKESPEYISTHSITIEV